MEIVKGKRAWYVILETSKKKFPTEEAAKAFVASQGGPSPLEALAAKHTPAPVAEDLSYEVETNYEEEETEGSIPQY